MGIYIYQKISKSVTREEWESVYEETLKLVEKFPLARRGSISYAGEEVICAVRTAEEEVNEFGKIIRGWSASMDYDTLKEAEEYFVPRDIVGEHNVDADAGDAMLGVLPVYLDYKWDDPKCEHVYSLWDSKTQGEPYHMYILAVACLIEDRLGEKAFVYGDITRGQCQKAVELANEWLEQPIQIPSRCDLERFFERISHLPLCEKEKLSLFERLYLGTKNVEFGDFVREHFVNKIVNEYWKCQFEKHHIGTRGFSETLKKYLAEGYDLVGLCRLADMRDNEGNLQYKAFIEKLMDTKLYVKEKNTRDYLEIDQESEYPYTIWTLMAQFAFGGSYNGKVDRYIPIEEIRSILIQELGDKCDVDSIINDCLAKEQEKDDADTFTKAMDGRRDKLAEDIQRYDIFDYDRLIYYQKGNSVHPTLQRALAKSYTVYQSILQEDGYKLLRKQSSKAKCKVLAEHNRYLLFRDTDWLHIFSEIEKNEEAIGRYYPMVCFNAGSKELNDMLKAFVLNDELYAYAAKLSLEADNKIYELKTDI